ncbi:MAG: glycosyltransferase, partial [Deltaproteobacteria bacterium]|nr:glycosyltransferase [Deltaproteobacteria bacterium]
RLSVLHLISTLDVGGAEQNLLRLTSSMDNTCFLSMVVSMTDIGPVGEELRKQDITVHSLNMKKGLPDPRGIYHLKRLVSLYQPDIIQCWMYHANLFGLLFSHKRHLIWNIRCSDMDLSRYGLIYKYTVKAGAIFSRIPDVVIANSFAGKEFHEGLGYSSRKWEVIPNGFDTDLFKFDKDSGNNIRLESGIPLDAPVIGLIARLDPMKDHETFFKAAELFLKIYPEAHLVLAGRDVENNNPLIMACLQGTSQPDHFHMLGQRRDIPQILSALDIASSSSSWGEGLPNTIGEAMATSIPCVVTDVGDSRVLVGDTGYVVPKNNPQALSTAWTRLIDSGHKNLRALGEKARERIRQHYSLHSTTKKYEALYSGLIQKSMI